MDTAARSAILCTGETDSRLSDAKPALRQARSLDSAGKRGQESHGPPCGQSCGQCMWYLCTLRYEKVSMHQGRRFDAVVQGNRETERRMTKGIEGHVLPRSATVDLAGGQGCVLVPNLIVPGQRGRNLLFGIFAGVDEPHVVAETRALG